MDEFSLINRYLKPLSAHAPEALGLEDDAALLPFTDGLSLIITKDAISEGVHFLPGSAAEHIAARLLRTNLSDIAAMGGTPTFYLIAAILPHGLDAGWYEAFTRQLQADQQQFGVALLGGDTVRHDDPLCLSLTMLGTVPADKALLRSQAQPGDGVYVSGTLGDAALGLAVAQGQLATLPPHHQDYLHQRYLVPEPRIPLAGLLAGMSRCAMDISDGLLGDAGHIAKASGVTLTLEHAALPLSPAAQAALALAPELAPLIYSGGDDYELLFTLPPRQDAALHNLATRLTLPLTRIGTVQEGRAGVQMIDKNGQILQCDRKGFIH